jgi:hypothetical protein
VGQLSSFELRGETEPQIRRLALAATRKSRPGEKRVATRFAKEVDRQFRVRLALLKVEIQVFGITSLGSKW